MSALTALLARDRIVSPPRIDEAIQRQVINGGDLETNLLEIGAIHEDTLTAYCAAVYDGEPASRDEVMAASPEAVARISRDVAETHRLIPLRVEHGTLVLAAMAPLPVATERTIEQLVGLKVDLRIATPFRLQWGLWRFYGTEINSRLQRLAQRLDGQTLGTTGEPPRPSMLSRPAPMQVPSAPRLPKVASALAALSAALTDERDSEVPPAPALSAPPEDLVAPPVGALSPLGQWGVTDTLHERIASASDRDQVVQALLELIASQVAYVALFTVRGGTAMAEGLDARGAGRGTDAVRKLSVPLEASSGAFGLVYEQGESLVCMVDETHSDQTIKEALGRPREAMVALVPIHIGGRVVLIAWADHAAAPLNPEQVTEITTACSEAARTFERLIVERKRKKAGSEPRQKTAVASVSKHSMRAQGPVSQTHSVAEWGISRPSVRIETRVEVPLTPAITETRVTALSEPLGGGASVAARQQSASASLPEGTPESREAAEVVLSDEEVTRLVAEIARTGFMNESVATRLLSCGERTLTAVFRYFPGPTAVDRMQTQQRLPSPAEAGPLLRLVVMFRQAAAAQLIACLDLSSPEQRYFAVLCLSEVVDPAALTQLLARLFDTDYPTRSLTVEVLRSYRKFHGFERVLIALRAVLADSSAPSERRRIAANALGELRDAEAVPALLVALGEVDAALVGLSRRALVVLSRQDFGEEPAPWRRWWETASRRHRIEWLIEALLHFDPTIRHEANEELKKLTGQFFGYYFNLPRREREKAHQRYLDWWEREGRLQFGPQS